MNNKYQLTVSGESARMILDNWLENNYPFDIRVCHGRKEGIVVIELEDLEYTCKLAKIYEAEIREV